MAFLSLAATEITALTRNFVWTNKSGCIAYIPTFKSLACQEVRQNAEKCCKKAVFCTFLSIAPAKTAALT